MIKNNNHYINFNTILDCLEGKLSAAEQHKLERYLKEHPVDQAALEGVRLIYEQEGMSREALLFFLEDSFPEYATASTFSPNNKTFINPYRSVVWIQTFSSAAAFIIICFMTMIPLDRTDNAHTPSVKIRVPCELGYGLDFAYIDSEKEI